jgi:hypothetical protein
MYNIRKNNNLPTKIPSGFNNIEEHRQWPEMEKLWAKLEYECMVNIRLGKLI